MNSRRQVVRDYLRRREEEQTLEEVNKKKEIIRSAYDTHTQIPYELKADALELLSQIIYDIHDTPEEKPLPRVMVTTSRDPSSMLREFSKRISLIFNGKLLSRGSMTLNDLADFCLNNRVTSLITLGESHGRPSSISITFYPTGPTFSFTVIGYKMKKTNKFSTMVGYIAEGFENELGVKIKTFFSLLFPREKVYKRYVVMVNKEDMLVLKHFNREEDLSLEMKLYEVKADKFSSECIAKPFMNSKKRRI